MGGFFFKTKHVLLILLAGFFNYLFDRAFNMAASVMPGLSILYLFQFSLFIPIMDGFLALTLLRFFRHTSKARSGQQRTLLESPAPPPVPHISSSQAAHLSNLDLSVRS